MEEVSKVIGRVLNRLARRIGRTDFGVIGLAPGDFENSSEKTPSGGGLPEGKFGGGTSIAAPVTPGGTSEGWPAHRAAIRLEGSSSGAPPPVCDAPRELPSPLLNENTPIRRQPRSVPHVQTGKETPLPPERNADVISANRQPTPRQNASLTQPEHLGLDCPEAPPDRACDLNVRTPVLGHEPDSVTVVIGQRDTCRGEEVGGHSTPARRRSSNMGIATTTQAKALTPRMNNRELPVIGISSNSASSGSVMASKTLQTRATEPGSRTQ